MISNIYTFYGLLQYVDNAFSLQLKEDDLNSSINNDKDKERKKKQKLRESMNNCHAGDPKDRNIVKQLIERLISVPQDFVIDGYPINYVVDESNIDNFVNWADPSSVNVYIKYLALLLHYESIYHDQALSHIIFKYNLNRLRTDSNGQKGFYVSSQDIHEVFEKENLNLSFDLKLKVLVQVVYEEYKGNSSIDTLLYQQIDDISVGVSGLPNEINPSGIKMPYAYEGCWIKFRGLLIHLRFLTLKDFDTLKKVAKQSVSYNQIGQFSEDNGYKSGYGKDGSRRTSSIEPFGECPATWIRKFTAKDKNNEDLVFANKKIKGAEKLIMVEKALIQGGATFPICGPQGVGKTTKLEAISEYIQNFYAIRMIESEFEARIRNRYPTKNIYTVQTNLISPDDAYNFSLRSSGDIYIISEARTDDMVVNITRTANRGGRSVLFTYHPNKPHNTPIEVANSLLRQKLYTSMKDAMYTTLNSIKCCEHLDIDYENNCRYYEIYEFRPTSIKIPTDFKNLTGEDRMNAFMETQLAFYERATTEDFFDTVPIITFDREFMEYRFNNNISDRFFDELYRNSSMLEEKRTMEKVFRPERALVRLIHDKNQSLDKLSANELMHMAMANNLNTDFLNEESVYDVVKELYPKIIRGSR